MSLKYKYPPGWQKIEIKQYPTKCIVCYLSKVTVLPLKHNLTLIGWQISVGVGTMNGSLLIAAPVVAAGLFAYHQYRTKEFVFSKFNIPDADAKGLRGIFTKIRNFVYCNTIQDRLWNYVEAHSEVGNPQSVLEAFDEYCYNYEWTWAIGDQKGICKAFVGILKLGKEGKYFDL